jgi:hypothetical protein
VVGVLKTKDKLKGFRRPDGAFGYMRYGRKNVPVSQGMPVTLPDLEESDVNATIICGPQTIHFSMDVLGLNSYRVPIFERDQYDRYIEILENNKKKAGI